MKVLAVIPARFASSRFPGKPLADILGKPMIQWVYERSKQAKLITEVLVATDDERIFQIVKKFQGHVEMTSVKHLSGTDRLLEITTKYPADIYINIQGDEPLIRPEMIDQAVQPLLDDPLIEVATLVTKIDDPGDLTNPNIVKVVFDKNNYALYFSRAGIPYNRDFSQPHQWLKNHPYWKHIGIYVYRKKFLLQFSNLATSHLEETEKLEQLRILENGIKIKVVVTNYSSTGVDTPDDLERVKSILTNERSYV